MSSQIQFYRRQLPESCIDFSIEKGKKLFTDSLLSGDANVYFKLAAQFRTQDEPAYCGLSTLVMVLNALEVDPGRIWKAPWRFYHESMLDCCQPLEEIMKTGVNLRQFACLATCNRLQVQLFTTVDSNDFLSKFRDHVTTSVRSEDTILVCSYDRKILGQTGSGHFSPLGAWHRESDRVLIMDVARFKYPPHWVELKLLMEAMCTVDDSTGRPRGYLLLSLDKGTMAPVVFRFNQNAVCSQPECIAQLAEWRQFLSNDRLDDDDQELKMVAETFTRLFSRYASCCQSIDLSCCGEQLTMENGDTAMAERLKQCKSDICKTIGDTEIAGYFNDPATVALFLAWPFELEIETKRCENLRSIVDEELDKLNPERRKTKRCEHLRLVVNEELEKLEKLNPETRNEVNVLHRQISVIVQCRSS